jgi:hypothetical protein
MNRLLQPVEQLHPPRRPPAQRWPLWLLAMLAAMLAIALYADTLKLPFFEDDPVHIRWLSWHGLFDPWLTAEALPDYRPLGRFIMQVWAGLLGWHNPVLLRAHNILLHVLNATLVAALTVRLHRGEARYRAAGAAALLFAAYPFAYQAVVWINVLFYPLVTFLLLGMAVCYVSARARPPGRTRNILLALAIGAAWLAPFEIEHAVMAFSVLAALEGIWWLAGWQRRVWVAGPALAMAGNLAFLVIWYLQPRFEYSFGFPTAERLAKNLVPFLQGLSFPAAPAARPLFVLRLVNDNLLAVTLVAVPVLAGLVALLWQRRALLLSGLAWFGLLSVPALAYLDFRYVHASPRLLYQVAPGAVMLWGAALAALWSSRGRGRWLVWGGRVLVAGLLFGGPVIGVHFAREQIGYYKMGTTPIAQADAAAAETPDDAQMLLVNMPAWVSPEGTPYALGTFGAEVFPDWIGAQDLIFAQRGEEQASREVGFANIRQATPYYYDVAGDVLDWDTMHEAILQASGGVYVTRYGDDAINLYYAGGVAPPAGDAPLAVFGDAVALLDAQVTQGDEGLVVSLTWRAGERMESDDTVFVHLVGPDGALASQADGYPLMGLSPFWSWEAGQVMEDVRYLDADHIDADGYAVWVGLYNANTGDRLQAADSDGGSLPDDRLLVWRN